LVDALGSVADLGAVLQNGNLDLATLCGIDQVKLKNITDSVDLSSTAFAEFAAIVNDAKNALECARINAVFVDLFHDALCTSSSDSFGWIFATGIVVYVFGMVVILCRGALLPAVVTERRYVGVESSSSQDREERYRGVDSSQDREERYRGVESSSQDREETYRGVESSSQDREERYDEKL